MVRAVGFFSELSPGWGFPEEGLMSDAVRSDGDPDESDIVAYLRDGPEIWSEMSAGTDVLDPQGPTLVAIGSLHTDGSWLWRKDLPYYVAKYHLSLPVEFIAHVRGLEYKIPELPESRLIRILAEDLGIDMD
jgi:hypothetical protein